MRFNVRAAGTALVAGTMLMAVSAAPAGAATTGPSLTHAVRDVHAANSALAQVSKLASSNPAGARGALARAEADIAAAAHQARWLHAGGAASTTASAFGDVAAQYDRDVQTYSALLKTSTGALQKSLAKALVPAIAGRTQALGFLGELTSKLSVADAKTATGTLTSVIGNGPVEIQSLTGLLDGGDMSAQIQQLIAQAIATAGGVLDGGITELEGIIPSLPTEVQPIVQTVLTELSGVLNTVQSTLQGTTTTFGGLLGGMFGTELNQVTSILQGILGDLPGIGGGTGLGGILGGTGTGTGTGTGGTGTGGILAGLPFGLGSILTGLLGELGISLPGI